jgi:osmotically-inducible protein OsmY
MAHRYDEDYRSDAPRGERSFRHDDRGFIERAGDQVRSWFGDEEAERRRHMDDERRHRERLYGYGTGYRETGGPRREYGGNFDYGWASERDRSYGPPIERGWAGERWERPDRWSGDYGRIEYDRSGAGWRMENVPGYQGWRTARPDVSRDAGESRGFYEDARGRVYQFDHVNYAGRGPKGYRRSDDRIREDVCDRLTDDGRIDASEIEVSVANGEVTLSGTVHSRGEKHDAEDMVANISGIRDVHNNLRVNR